jgi:hypothetical protein
VPLQFRKAAERERGKGKQETQLSWSLKKLLQLKRAWGRLEKRYLGEFNQRIPENQEPENQEKGLRPPYRQIDNRRGHMEKCQKKFSRMMSGIEGAGLLKTERVKLEVSSFPFLSYSFLLLLLL